jgi:hypothetical protein
MGPTIRNFYGVYCGGRNEFSRVMLIDRRVFNFARAVLLVGNSISIEIF